MKDANFGLDSRSTVIPVFDRSGDRIASLVWWVTLLAPVVVTLGIVMLIGLTRGWTAVAGLAGMAVASLLFGKFIILGGEEAASVMLAPHDLVLLVIVMDLLAACWFVYHLRFMLRLPFLGPRFRLLVQDGEYVLASYPGIRRAAFAGLVLFVAIPFSMTGSVGGAILARLLGMQRHATFLAIACGSVLGAMLMYLFGSVIDSTIGRNNPIWRWGGFFLLASLLILIQYRYQIAKKRLVERSTGSKEPFSLRS